MVLYSKCLTQRPDHTISGCFYFFIFFSVMCLQLSALMCSDCVIKNNDVASAKPQWENIYAHPPSCPSATIFEIESLTFTSRIIWVSLI